MKRIPSVLWAVLVWAALLSGCRAGDSQGGRTPVTLAEAAHSVFYAPQYAAIELGYFKEQAIDLTLLNSQDTGQAMADLAAGKAQIGLMGPEASVYAYFNGAADHAVNFAQLTQRAGDFLVSRTPEPDFSWDCLRGRTVLGGKAGSMPQMVFEYILKKHGIDPKRDLTVDQSASPSQTAAFDKSGAQYALGFEPWASSLVLSGKGYITASLGEGSGYVPYTAYCTKGSFLEEEPGTVQGFVNAIQQGLNYVSAHTPEEIARTIAPQFKEIPEESIASAIRRYKEQDTWKEDTVFEPASFRLLENIMEEAGALNGRAPYEDLVATGFSEAARN